ncbi:hypothetical protein GCM10008929_20220 [Alkalibacterium psychrotolerans]
MNAKERITKAFAYVVVWSILIGLSAIALGLIIRGVLSVWSFIL